MPKRKREAGEFRINRHKVGLTWSCPVDIEVNPIVQDFPDNPCEAIRDHFTEKYGVNDHTISQEDHQSGKKHFHAWFNFHTKLDTMDPRCFDFCTVHPNILNPGKGWEAYVAKGKDFISNHFEKNAYHEAIESGSADTAIDILWTKAPRDMAMQGHNIERNLRRRLQAPCAFAPNVYEGPYPHLKQLDAWDPSKFSLLLWGPPGVHKTQFAKYLMAHKFGDYEYFKGHYEGVKKLSLQKAFIHDEAYYNDIDANISKEITDVENGGEIKCRHSNVTIQPGIPRVFISNYEYPFRNPQEAVYGRRLVSVCVQQL